MNNPSTPDFLDDTSTPVLQSTTSGVTMQPSNTTATFQSVEDIKAEVRQALIPCIVLVVIFMFVGISGNSLVCYVFGVRFKQSTQNFCILCLAVFDLLSCTIGMPSEITDMALHLEFPSDMGCKIMRFVNTFTAMGSICTLIIIAIDRFRRVYHPLKRQIPDDRAKLLLIPILGFALLFSWPAPVVYGLRTVETGVPGVQGHDCTIADNVKDTIAPLLYNGFLFIAFVVLTISLIVLYSLILRGLKQHQKYIRKASLATTMSSTEEEVEEVIVEKHDNEMKGVVQKCSDNIQEDSGILGNGETVNVDLNNSLTSKARVNSVDETVPNQASSEYLETPHTKSDTDNVKEAATAREHNSQIGLHKGEDEDATFESGNGRRKKSLTVYGKFSNSNTAQDEKKNLRTNSMPPNFEMNYFKENQFDQQQGRPGPVASVSSETDTNTTHVSFDLPEMDQDNPERQGTCQDGTTSLQYHGIPNISTNRRPSTIPILSEEGDNHENFVGCLNPAFRGDNDNVSLPAVSELANNLNRVAKQTTQPDKKVPKVKNITRKTTIIVFVVTIVFILSFVPHLSLQVAHLINKGFDEKLRGAALGAYNTFLRSYFINSIANPIIYGALNQKFRDEVVLLITRFRCKKESYA